MNLQTNSQSFAVFDWIMGLLAFFAILFGALGLLLGDGWRIVTYVMAVGLGLLAYGIWLAPKRLKVTKLREPLVKAPKTWLKAIFVADLHAGPQTNREWFDRVFSHIKEIQPDVLLLGGDFVVCDTSYLDQMKGLAELDFSYGKYFVLGNHDYLDDPAEVTKQLQEWGLTDLTNTSRVVRFQGHDLVLAGLDDALLGVPKLPQLEASGPPRVVLAHEPDLLLDMREGQAELALCGHTHGGQIRLPVIGSMVVPSKLKRHADMGRRIINGIPVFVSRGLGEVLCRARLFCPPEIVILELGI